MYECRSILQGVPVHITLMSDFEAFVRLASSSSNAGGAVGAGAIGGVSGSGGRPVFGREFSNPQYYVRKDLSNVAGYASSERLFLMPPIAYRMMSVSEIVVLGVTRADRGEWTCLVENRVGEIRASVYVDVFGTCARATSTSTRSQRI